jgi:hypothetical protein
VPGINIFWDREAAQPDNNAEVGQQEFLLLLEDAIAVYGGCSDFASPLLLLVRAHLCILWQSVNSTQIFKDRMIRSVFKFPRGTLTAFTLPMATEKVLLNAAVLVILASAKVMINLIDFFLCLRVVVEQSAFPFVTSLLSRPARKCLLTLRLNDVLLYQLDKFDGQSVDVTIVACAESVA